MPSRSVADGRQRLLDVDARAAARRSGRASWAATSALARSVSGVDARRRARVRAADARAPGRGARAGPDRRAAPAAPRRPSARRPQRRTRVRSCAWISRIPQIGLTRRMARSRSTTGLVSAARRAASCFWASCSAATWRARKSGPRSITWPSAASSPWSEACSGENLASMSSRMCEASSLFAIDAGRAGCGCVGVALAWAAGGGVEEPQPASSAAMETTTVRGRGGRGAASARTLRRPGPARDRMSVPPCSTPRPPNGSRPPRSTAGRSPSPTWIGRCLRPSICASRITRPRRCATC